MTVIKPTRDYEITSMKPGGGYYRVLIEDETWISAVIESMILQVRSYRAQFPGAEQIQTQTSARGPTELESVC